MSVSARRRGTHLVPWWFLGLCVLLSGVLFFGGLCLAILRDEPRALPGRTVTVTVPGPTTTVSYLVEVTVTPGVTYGY